MTAILRIFQVGLVFLIAQQTIMGNRPWWWNLTWRKSWKRSRWWTATLASRKTRGWPSTLTRRCAWRRSFRWRTAALARRRSRRSSRWWSPALTGGSSRWWTATLARRWSVLLRTVLRILIQRHAGLLCTFALLGRYRQRDEQPKYNCGSKHSLSGSRWLEQWTGIHEDFHLSDQTLTVEPEQICAWQDNISAVRRAIRDFHFADHHSIAEL